MSKPYLYGQIDRAIVMTQYDLRGFRHPVGIRIKKKNPKLLFIILHNLICFAAGVGRVDEHDGSEYNEPTDPRFVSPRNSTFDDCLAMCRRLADCCDESQKEAIQLIIKELIMQGKEFEEQKAVGKNNSAYIEPFDKGNTWGKMVLSLAEAFQVPLEERAPVQA